MLPSPHLHFRFMKNSVYTSLLGSLLTMKQKLAVISIQIQHFYQTPEKIKCVMQGIDVHAYFWPFPHDNMLTSFMDVPWLDGVISTSLFFFSSKYKVTKEKLYVLYTKHHYNVIQCPIKGDHNWITVWIVWAKQPSLRERKKTMNW